MTRLARSRRCCGLTAVGLPLWVVKRGDSFGLVSVSMRVYRRLLAVVLLVVAQLSLSAPHGPDPAVVDGWLIGTDASGRPVSAGDGSQDLWVVPDRHGDVSAGVSTAGALAMSRVFDPFGGVAGVGGSVAVPLGFQGDVTDGVTGDVWMSARWYSPGLGGFRSRDSWGGVLTSPGTANRYAYGAGDPLGSWDPSGRWPEDLGSSISGFASSVRDRLQGGGVQGGLSSGAVEAAKAQVAALKAAEVEAAEGRARGDVAYATGVSTVAGPVALISAVSSPDQGVWASLKWVASTAVSIGAAVACQPLGGPVAGVCAGVAGRFTDGLLSGKSPGELFRYTLNPLSMGRDAALGAMTMGFGRVAAGLVPKAGSALPVVLGSAAASVVAGGLTDMAVVLAGGGSWEDAIAKAMDPTARGIDFAMGFAEGRKVWKGRPTANTTAATNNVIVDTNAVYNRPGTLGALRPGETPVMTRTTVGELANNAASGRLKPPGFANELGVVDDVMDVNTRINIRGELQAIRPGQRGLFGDGSIGATAVNTGYPVITADKNFATVLEGMGVQVRRI